MILDYTYSRDPSASFECIRRAWNRVRPIPPRDKTMDSLKSHHLEDLRNSGLNDKTIAEGGFTSLTAEQTKTILGFEAGPGMGIEYPRLNNEPPFIRVKPDKPSKDKKGRPAKYLTPRGTGNHLYILPFVQEVLKNPTFPILITEGEKKAAKAVQEGYYCIALPGVWCFRQGKGDRKRPIPDLDLIEWGGRIVYICFDSDLAENENVLHAESVFAREMEQRGATVRVARLPDGPKGEKVGLDDFLVAHGEQGKAELDKLIDAAEEPQNPLIQTQADPEFIEPALAFVDGKVMVTRMMVQKRQHKRSKSTGRDSKDDFVEYDVWEPQIITSEKQIIQPPGKITKNPNEIIPLGKNFYLKKPLEDAESRWSIDSVRSFLKGQSQAPDVAILVNDIINTFKEWCYFPNEYTYTIISLHVIGSYFFELFPAYPYLNLNGPQGSGKTTAGRVAAALAFNGKLLIDPSQASLFRMIEREKPYLVIDEKENIGSRKSAEANPGLMALLKSGYQKGAKIPRQNTTHIEKTEFYGVYSPKLICNVHGLEDILQDRSISLITQPAPKDSKIRGYQPDVEHPIWQNLRDRLYLTQMYYHEEIRKNRDANLGGEELARLREKELFKPLVDMALWIDSINEDGTLTKQLLGALSLQKDARSFARNLTPEAQLINALYDLLGSEETRRVHTGQIKQAIADQSTDTPEWCSDVWIGKTLRKLNIWQNKQDSKRERALVAKDGGAPEDKMLTHYLIKKNRLPEM